MLQPTKVLVLLAVLFAGLPLPASTIYADWASWQGAVSTYTTVDFEGITDDFASYSTSAGLTIGDIQFVGISDNGGYALWVVDSTAYPDHDFGTGDVLKGPAFVSGYSAILRILLPATTTALAFDLGTYITPSSVYTISLDTGEQFPNISVGARPNTTFFGVTSTVPFTQVDVLMTTGVNWESQPILDNVAYGLAGGGGTGGGGPSEVPETTTFLLVGSGLILFWRWRRRAPEPAV